MSASSADLNLSYRNGSPMFTGHWLLGTGVKVSFALGFGIYLSPSQIGAGSPGCPCPIQSLAI